MSLDARRKQTDGFVSYCNPQSQSFYPRCRRKKRAEGIRLRCDSTGSIKSAFYQGTITSAEVSHRRMGATRSRQRHTKNTLESQGGQTSLLAADVDAAATAPTSSKQDLGSSEHHKSVHFNSSIAISDGVSTKSIGEMNCQGKLDGTYSKDQLKLNDSLRYSTRTLMTATNQADLFGADCLEDSTSNNDGDLQGSMLDIDYSPSRARGMWHPTDDIRFSVRTAKSSAEASAYFRQPAPPGPAPIPFVPAQLSTSYQHESLPYINGIEESLGAGSHPAPQTIYSRQETTVSVLSNDSRPRWNLESVPRDNDSILRKFGSLVDQVQDTFNIKCWLLADLNIDEDGNPVIEETSGWTISGFVRDLFYHPIYPEFTSVQHFTWSVLLGILMGFLTAVWKTLIKVCVRFVWRTAPEILLDFGIFSSSEGFFPLYHYMWIVPSIFGGALSYVCAALPTPIPSQNDWIHNLHSRGIQDLDTFFALFFVSTAGMASGLSLSPELPLILAAGMIGSWLGVFCKQSTLSARILNVTAASAAVSGFFGFPMAGALFVLEVPHRMGLQYFEAITPSTIASIVAVLTNRLVIGNDVTGYYQYPFLNESLPSSIFYDAICFGLFGGALGIIYTKVVLVLKEAIRIFLRRDGHQNKGPVRFDEASPLVHARYARKGTKMELFSLGIAHEPTRAGVVGALAGALVGITCIFVPHVMFWGESQLQSLIDKGRTPLPIFGQGDEPSAGLVSLGMCMVQHGDEVTTTREFSMGCSALIAVAKIFVTGLSLGTGIIGGHFWAPLFVGCAASHFLTDLVKTVSQSLGKSFAVSSYPGVALLCCMGSCHVVPFRAHMAIILILILTIEAFDSQDDAGATYKVAGDYSNYSAVLPLLAIAVFVAMQISRQVVFYKKQRSRGDIMALPEVLCEPGKGGRPLVMDFGGKLHELDESDYEYESETEEESLASSKNYRTVDYTETQLDIERDLMSTPQAKDRESHKIAISVLPNPDCACPTLEEPKINPILQMADDQLNGPIDPLQAASRETLIQLDDWLNGPIDGEEDEKEHRRAQSEPLAMQDDFGVVNETSYMKSYPVA